MNARELIRGAIVGTSYSGGADWEFDDMADAILAAMPDIIRAMVVPLVWEEVLESGGFHNSGNYSVYHGRTKCSLVVVGEDGISITCGASIAEAMTAANAHHAAQIMTGLGL
tara:strand:- start:2365 stop:2700 length:336 start_codon:yes stop_codon:yes gene_type:complete